MGKGKFINKNSQKMILHRFLMEFEAVCLDRGYDEATKRLSMEETIRFVQDVGYLSDPRRTDPTGPRVSVIEEQCCTEMWKYLTANSKEATEADHGQLPPEAGVHDIKVFLLAVMGFGQLFDGIRRNREAGDSHSARD